MSRVGLFGPPLETARAPRGSPRPTLVALNANGDTLRAVAQNVSEFWAAATRPPADGLGLFVPITLTMSRPWEKARSRWRLRRSMGLPSSVMSRSSPLSRFSPLRRPTILTFPRRPHPGMLQAAPQRIAGAEASQLSRARSPGMEHHSGRRQGCRGLSAGAAR